MKKKGDDDKEHYQYTPEGRLFGITEKMGDHERRITVIEKFLILIAFFMVVAGGAIAIDGNNRRGADRQMLGGGVLAVVGVLGLISLMSGDRQGNEVRRILEFGITYARFFGQGGSQSTDTYSSFSLTKD